MWYDVYKIWDSEVEGEFAMPKGANQKRKLLILRDILHTETDEQHPLTLAQLQELLAARGVSAERKSLYDDLEQLRLQGDDIVTVRDRYVRYYMGQRDFDLPELRLLVDAVQSSKFITLKKSEKLIRQLENLTSRHQAVSLQRQVVVSRRIKSMNESIYYNVDALQQAMTEDCQVTFRYFEWDRHKQRQLRRGGALYTVSPWTLLWDSENYYLVAYSAAADSIRHYRVDRMLQISPIDDKRQGADVFGRLDMGVYTRGTFGMFGGVQQAVTLHCAPHMAGVILDRFGQDTTLVPHGDGFAVRVAVAVSPQFFGWLAGLGGDVSVADSDVAAEYRTYLEKLLSKEN